VFCMSLLLVTRADAPMLAMFCANLRYPIRNRS
jgi:hypothetical protein